MGPLQVLAHRADAIPVERWRGGAGVLARLAPPTGLEPRLRWSFLAICLLRLSSLAPQLVLAPGRGALVHAGAGVLMVATAAWWVRCYRRGSFPLPGMVLEGATLATVAAVLGDPFRAVSLAYLMAMFHALAREPRRSAAFAAVVLAVLAGATVAIAPDDQVRSVFEVLFAFVGIPAFMVAMHLVSRASAQADWAMARERTIAQSGLDIARAVDEDGARAVSRSTALDLLTDVEGATARLLAAGTAPPQGAGAWQDFPVPITDRDQRVIRVVSTAPLRDEVARALAIVATQLALALGKSALTQDLERRAGEDPLTGLLNRRRLDEVLGSALEASGAREPVAVLTVDLDRFKEVNDVHGHAVGDALLVAVAARMRSHLREGDAVARLGGDEFLVLLAGYASGRAHDLAQRLLGSITAPFEVAGRTVRVGASIGVALAAPGQSAHEVMRASDGAMYAAKQGGRGRVVTADGARARLDAGPGDGAARPARPSPVR